MNETSRINCSRAFQGSRPRTVNCPSYEVRPRIALSAVVLPAPFGPIRPRMRPSSTRRLMPSSATVVPKALRRPRASMHAMSALLLCVVGRRLRLGFQQLFRFQPEPPNGFLDPGPLFRQKLLAFAPKQQLARAGVDEHPSASLALDELLVDQLLVGFQNRDRIDAILGRDVADGRKRIALLEHAVEDQGDDAVAKLAIDRLTVVPFAFHFSQYAD